MNSDCLYIDFENMRNIAVKIEETGERLDEILSQYISVLSRAQREVFISGEFSNELSIFTAYAKALQGRLKYVAARCAGYCGQMLYDVEDL